MGFLGALAVAAYAPAHAQCPGRVNVIVEVEHPTVPLADHDGLTTWATMMDSVVQECVQDGTFSQDYGYYLDMKIMARVVRAVCLTGSEYDKRQALAQFDRTVIEGRPYFLSASFRSLVHDLNDQLHSQCLTGGI